MHRLGLLVTLTVLSLAFAPAPLPKPRKLPPAPTEVILEVAKEAERIELTYGKRKVEIDLDGPWEGMLADCLMRFRANNPPPQLLIFRCDADVLSPSKYITIRRTCSKAGYRVRVEEAETYVPAKRKVR